MDTVAEENPLRSATSRMVTAAGCVRLREESEMDARRDFAEEALRVGFESADSMFQQANHSLNLSLLLADTTGR
jgi:hypothetical protein